MSEALKRAQAKYDAAHTKQIRLKLNIETDADVLKRLDEVGNKQGYIKELIRKDIALSHIDKVEMFDHYIDGYAKVEVQDEAY